MYRYVLLVGLMSLPSYSMEKEQPISGEGDWLGSMTEGIFPLDVDAVDAVSTNNENNTEQDRFSFIEKSSALIGELLLCFSRNDHEGTFQVFAEYVNQSNFIDKFTNIGNTSLLLFLLVDSTIDYAKKFERSKTFYGGTNIHSEFSCYIDSDDEDESLVIWDPVRTENLEQKIEILRIVLHEILRHCDGNKNLLKASLDAVTDIMKTRLNVSPSQILKITNILKYFPSLLQDQKKNENFIYPAMHFIFDIQPYRPARSLAILKQSPKQLMRTPQVVISEAIFKERLSTLKRLR